MRVPIGEGFVFRFRWVVGGGLPVQNEGKGEGGGEGDRRRSRQCARVCQSDPLANYPLGSP